MLPDAVRAAVAAALGGSDAIRTANALGGGCISPAARLETNAGARYFIKWAETAPADFFAEEARSLRELGATNTVRVPDVVACDEQWLLLEWLESGDGGRTAWHELGRQLARLHRCTVPSFGWHADNYIGSLPQANRRSTSWPDFWSERRLQPQLEAARRAGLLARADEARFAELGALLPDVLAAGDEDGPSLLHGDLWNGNVQMGVAGGALIDPSAYYGHREVDLAMAQLFGGFDGAFFEGYECEWPTRPGSEARRPIYQLYYLLVHVNLFGAGYVAPTRAALDRGLSLRPDRRR